MDPVDFVAGSLSGALSQLFGHPFDTIKVRMQTSPEIYNRGVLQSFRLILAREGPLAFFRGVCAVSDVIISYPPLCKSYVTLEASFVIFSIPGRLAHSNYKYILFKLVFKFCH